MPNKTPVAFISSKGITEFSAYYLRIKKEIDILKSERNYLITLIGLVIRNKKNEVYLKRLQAEINSVRFLSIYSVIKLRKVLKNQTVLHIHGHRAFFNCWLATRFLTKKPKLVFDYHGAGP